MRNKKALLFIAALSAIFLFGTSAYADWGWYTCDIEQSGYAGGRYLIRLANCTGTRGTPGTTNDQWKEFYSAVSDSGQNIMIANILTAISLSVQVDVLIDPDIRASLYALYLVP
jgi:hypothetical protein